MSLSLDPRIGSELFGYRIEGLLGRGGMSVVYRAHDPALDRKVALKLLALELTGDERFRSRFLKESRVAASLDHPNVIPIYEAGEAEGVLCIAMRYVEGTDLKHLLREEGALAPDLALDYCAQIASALDAAHARGLVHRDVKPSNVLIGQGGHCYLADFGLTYDASESGDLTLAGQIVGSVDYAAPEQIEGKPVDGRADVYSLGCLLYECLTGKVPFTKDSDLAVLWAHVNEPPPKLEVHPTLDPVLKRGLAKQPKDRYPTCSALVDATRAALPRPDPEPPHRGRKLLAGLGALLLAGALAAGLTLALSEGTSRAKADLTVHNNSLVRLDPETNKIAHVTADFAVPFGDIGPVDVAVARDTVWVYNWGDHTVRAVDSKTNSVEQTFTIGGSAPPTGNAIAADAGGAWVLKREGNFGVLVRATLGVGLPRPIHLGYEPLSVAVGGGAVWVAAKSSTAEVVLKISPSTGKVLDTVHLQGADVQSIAYGQGFIWVLQDGAITRIDPRSDRTKSMALRSFEVQDVAAGDGAVWITMRLRGEGNVLVRLDPHTLRRTKTIPTPVVQGTLTRVSVNGGAVWWNGIDSGTVWRVDATTGTVVKTIRITPPAVAMSSFEPVGIAAGADAVWVTVTPSP